MRNKYLFQEQLSEQNPISFSKKMSLISIEYPKAATANHNQYFRRDTRVYLFISAKQTNKQTNKQQQYVGLIVCFIVKKIKRAN